MECKVNPPPELSKFSPDHFHQNKWVDPDLLGGDTDPINYCVSLINSYRVKIATSMGDDRLYNPDPVPQTRIRILVTTYVVCFVSVVGRRPWLYSRVVIPWKCFEISNLVWRHAYCSACLLPLPRFSFQPTPAPPPLPLPGGGGGCCSNLIRYV